MRSAEALGAAVDGDLKALAPLARAHLEDEIVDGEGAHADPAVFPSFAGFALASFWTPYPLGTGPIHGNSERDGIHVLKFMLSSECHEESHHEGSRRSEILRSDTSFADDPLVYLDEAFPAAGDAVRLPQNRLLLSEAAASRAVLANEDGLYEEHSDFFQTRRGVFGPRELQVEIGRSARAFLRSYLRDHESELPEAVARLAPESEWPDAGNWLLFRHLGPALVAPDSPQSLLRTVEDIVRRAVLAGARRRYSRLTRAIFRFRATRELVRAVKIRRSRSGGEPADVLEVIVRAGGSEATAEELAEVFLSFLFATTGSVGFVLGWSLFLVGTNPPTDAHPAWIVREALRLWPVAWFLERRPSRSHNLAGAAVTPSDRVAVCPYAVHRNPRHWDDPDSFRPERWAAAYDPQAFIPFGWGPHRCVAGGLSMDLAEEILRLIRDGYQATVTAQDARPCISVALAPPRFTLQLTPFGTPQ